MSKVLDVYLQDRLVGKLIQEKTNNLIFRYEDSYVSLSNGLPISLCMPTQSSHYEGQTVKAVFSGLLPDDLIRYKVARFLGVSEENEFALLENIGGECAGALSLFPEGKVPPPPKDGDVEVLSEQKLIEILDLLKRNPLLVGSDNIRLSLAGAQNKIAVRLVNEKIALARGTTPTSHIMKPLIEGISDSVQNEYFCLTLAKRIGINTPSVEIRWIGTVPYFLIERYDRHTVNGQIKRVHQEDFCQAMGILPEFKYEREGGPSVLQSLSLLNDHSETPAIDSISFLKILIFNYIIGNSDAHGKNFSLLYKKQKPVLAPCYDLMSTAVYPSLASKMAMKIGKIYDPEKVFLRHWYQIIPDTKAAQKMLNKDLNKISVQCLAESQQLRDQLRTEGNKSHIFDDICAVIEQRVQHLFKL